MITLEQVQQLLTVLATATGVYVALSGLRAWRNELIGRRDIELCQSVIELFYEAEQKVSILRSPFSYSTESKREREQGESEREANFRDHAFVPLTRFNNQSDFWQEFFSFKFRMRALFGEHAIEAFTLVDEVLRNFRAAAQTRFQSIRGDRFDLNHETLRSFEEIIWMLSEEDELASRMKDATRKMETVCIPIVRQKLPIATQIWRWLASL